VMLEELESLVSTSKIPPPHKRKRPLEVISTLDGSNALTAKPAECTDLNAEHNSIM
jgi:hypothetical protein